MKYFNMVLQKLMRRHWGKVFLAFIVVFCFLFPSVKASAAAERDTIRIGFFTSEKYGYVGADGNLRGYDIQLSKTIGMYGGFDTEMLAYDNVTEMEDALRAGDVDVLIDFLRTEKREQEFIFTNSPILEEQVSLYTYNSSDALTADRLSETETLRVGHVTDSGFLDYFTDYCTESGIKLQLVGFYSESDMHSAMERGETDACVTGSAVPAGYRVLVSTPPINSYMMFRAGDTSLRRRFDMAISRLKTDDPDYMLNLYQRYVASHDTEMTPLSAQEREYLKNHNDLTVAVVRGAEPFTVEKEDGSLGGVIPDYYREIGERLGVTFRFVAYDKTQDAIEAVKNKEADILGHYYGDIIIAERDDLYDTMEYGATECARLTKSGFNGSIRTAAVTNRTAFLLAEQLDPDIRLETYSNVEEGYQAMMRGETDAVIGSMTGVTWLVNQHTMRGVSLSVLPNVKLAIRAAVSRDDPELLFVLNKAIAISGNALNEAIIENAVDGKTNLRTALENLPLGFTIGAVAVLTTLVIFLVVLLVLLARFSRERMALLNREMNVDGLTGAGSRRYGTELINRELLLFRRYGDGPMLAMFDVDYFKRKNDTYGHEYGDFVLKKVVDILHETLRKSDAIIRWGGDEFILICPHIRGDGADRIMEKVIHAINSADFLKDGKGEKITISAGASFFKPEDRDMTPVLRRCDSALYEAKRVRNTYRVFSDETGDGSPVRKNAEQGDGSPVRKTCSR